MRLISHRLRGFDTKEQTLKGFINATEAGVYAFEIDLRKCKTGEIVVNHDATLKREYSINSLISQLEYDESNYKFKNSDYSPFLFTQFLEYFSKITSSEKLLLLDIKEHGYEKEIYNLITLNNLNKFCIIVSWLPEVLRKFKMLDNELILCFSHYAKSPLISSLSYKVLISGRAIFTKYFSNDKNKTKLFYNSLSSSIKNSVVFTDEEHIISNFEIAAINFLTKDKDFLCIDWKEWNEEFNKARIESGLKLCFYNIKNNVDLNCAQILKPDLILTDASNHLK